MKSFDKNTVIATAIAIVAILLLLSVSFYTYRVSQDNKRLQQQALQMADSGQQFTAEVNALKQTIGEQSQLIVSSQKMLEEQGEELRGLKNVVFSG